MAGLAERSAGATRSRSMTLICWESRVATPTDAANETSAASRPTPIRTSPSPTTPDHPSTSGSPVAGPRRHRGVVVTAVAAVALSVSMVGCSDSDVDETPVPGDTESPTGTVMAPSGTNMGAPPINAGTVAGG